MYLADSQSNRRSRTKMECTPIRLFEADQQHRKSLGRVPGVACRELEEGVP